MEKSVTHQITITDKDIADAKKIEQDPEKILALIDLIFMGEDRTKILPS